MKAKAAGSSTIGSSTEQCGQHDSTFAKVFDGRKQPVRGLWVRNGRFYAQLSIEDFSTGTKRVRRVPLINSEGKAVETTPQAITELNRLRTKRGDDQLPKLGRTPTFTHYADEYLAHIKSGVGTKKPATIAKEKGTLKLWKDHLGGIRLDKIRPANVASFMRKRLNGGMCKRTVHLDVIAFRNVMKHARDVDEHINDIPVPRGVSRQLKSSVPERALFSPADLEKLCAAAMAKKEDGSPVTKNAVQFCDYLCLMAFSGARRNEALALLWQNVNFKLGQLTIGADDDTKNSTARVVNFNSALKAHLLAMRSRRAPDSKWLFPSPQRGDKDVPAKSFRESLELARTAAKLPSVGFHDMRHLFISFCVMSGIDFMTLAKWVGHRDGGVLIGKVYGHLADDHRKAMAEKVSFGPAILEHAANE